MISCPTLAANRNPSRVLAFQERTTLTLGVAYKVELTYRVEMLPSALCEFSSVLCAICNTPPVLLRFEAITHKDHRVLTLSSKVHCQAKLEIVARIA